jgi:hypothetical protein
VTVTGVLVAFSDVTVTGVLVAFSDVTVTSMLVTVTTYGGDCHPFG